MRILVSAASRYGATAEIAGALGEGLRRRGHEVAVVPPDQVGSLTGYDAVVLGSGLYSGHWLDPAVRLAERSAGSIGSRPVYLFSSGPVGGPKSRLAEKMAVDPAELPQLRQRTHARTHRIFPGRLDRHSLPRVQRLSLALFRGLEGDFRDWDAVDEWAAKIDAELSPGAPPAAPRDSVPAGT